MPYSLDIYNKDIQAHITALDPKSVLDVGAGMGKYGNLVRSVNPHIICDAVEASQEYIDSYGLKSKYRNIFVKDIIDHVRTDMTHKYDLCIMGDVLEHLFLSQAMDIIDALAYKCKYLMIIWPTNLPQDYECTNTYEMHKSNFTIKDISRFNIQAYKKTYGYNISPGVPMDMHYALIAGHTTSPEHSMRRMDIKDNIVYGVINDV
jgi:hypothetical protein